jgi:hypothetical protein
MAGSTLAHDLQLPFLSFNAADRMGSVAVGAHWRFGVPALQGLAMGAADKNV